MKLYDYEKEEKIYTKTRKRAFAIRFFVVLLGIFVLLFAMILGIRIKNNVIKSPEENTDGKFQPVVFQFRKEPKELGTIESMIKYEKSYAIGIRFPKLDDEKVDEVIRGNMEEMVARFQEELADYKAAVSDQRAVYTVDYDIYPNTERYVSVVYHIEKNLPQKNQLIQMVQTRIYDLENDLELSLKDIFEDSFLTKVSGLVSDYFETDSAYREKQKTNDFDSLIQPKWKNYQNISFSKENITVYFNGAERFFKGMSGVLSVVIPAEKAIDTMKINLTGLQVTDTSVIDPNKPMVALTFDDGPYPKVTERILDQLEQNHARATFFILGNRIAGNEETIKRASSLGCEIESHTYDHQNLTKLTPERIKGQVNTTNNLVSGVLGIGTALVRPPYGAINDLVRANIGKPMITWSIDTLDWKTKDSAQTIANILDHVQDGDIVLMHDLYDQTADACDTVIPELTRRGYQLVTVSEMMASRGVTLEAGKTYYKARP